MCERYVVLALPDYTAVDLKTVVFRYSTRETKRWFSNGAEYRSEEMQLQTVELGSLSAAQTYACQASSMQPSELVTVDEATAYRAAEAYVQADIVRENRAQAFELSSGTQYYSKPLEQEIWRFILRCPYGPLESIQVDVESGKVFRLSVDEVRVLHEKVAIYEARQNGVLPLNKEGYVLGEYARRIASRYLDNHLSMHFSAADPLFVPGESPIWQMLIRFRLPNVEPFTLGILDVDAQTGEPHSLSKDRLEQIRERTRAIIEHQTSAAAVQQ